MATQRPAPTTENGPIRRAENSDGSSTPDATESDKEKSTASITATKLEGDEQHSEVSSDGVFHQIIVKDGKDVLVTWTIEEESRVVRKADFLFLPIFAVRMLTLVHGSINVELLFVSVLIVNIS